MSKIEYCTRGGSIQVESDLNVDKPSDSAVPNVLAVLKEFGLIQHTHCAIHISGHTLNLVITRSDNDLLHDSPNAKVLFSDHFALEFKCNLDLERAPTQFLSYRKTSNIG